MLEIACQGYGGLWTTRLSFNFAPFAALQRCTNSLRRVEIAAPSWSLASNFPLTSLSLATIRDWKLCKRRHAHEGADTHKSLSYSPPDPHLFHPFLSLSSARPLNSPFALPPTSPPINTCLLLSLHRQPTSHYTRWRGLALLEPCKCRDSRGKSRASTPILQRTSGRLLSMVQPSERG